MALRPKSSLTPAEKLAEQQDAEKSALLREVDDAVRQEQALVAAKRYGIPIFLIAVCGLLGFGGYLWWDHTRERSMEASSEELIRAVDNVEHGHLDTADKALAPLAENGTAGIQATAKLLQAGIALKQGRKAEAVKLYAEVAANSDVPAPYRDLANIRGVAANFDAMDPDDVIKRLKPLAVPGNAWFGSAGELLGAAYLKQGKKDLAGPLFASIAKDEGVPETLRSRARQLAGLLGYDAVTDVKQLVSTADADETPVAQVQ